MTDIDVYLYNNPNHRDHPIDFADMRRLGDKVVKSYEPVGATSSVSKKGKEKEAKKIEACCDYDLRIPVMKIKEEDERTPSEVLIEKLGWTLERFGQEYFKNLRMMPQHPFNRPCRLSKRLGLRILVMGGLMWNANSKNKARDYAYNTIATCLETALIESYRPTLLRDCAAALHLRQIIKQCFQRFFLPHYGPTVIEIPFPDDWTFPDGYAFQVPLAITPPCYDPSILRKKVEAAHAASATMKNNPGMDFLHKIFRIKLLQSSDPKAPNGAIEKSAEVHIRALLKVRISLLLNFILTSPFSVNML